MKELEHTFFSMLEFVVEHEPEIVILAKAKEQNKFTTLLAKKEVPFVAEHKPEIVILENVKSAPFESGRDHWFKVALTLPWPARCLKWTPNTHALLILPEKFTEHEFYATIAGISSLGDPRKAFPAENPRKVAIIVDHNMRNLRRLYAPLIESLLNTCSWLEHWSGAQDDGNIAHYPKRKRSSIYNDLSEDKLEGSLRSGADDGDKRPVRKHGLGSVLLGYWRDSPVPKPAGKHAVVGLIDVRDRLRTRIQNTTRNGDAINTRLFPVPPGRDTNSVDHNMQNFRRLAEKEAAKGSGCSSAMRGTDYEKLGRLLRYKNFRSAKNLPAKLRRRLYKATDLGDGENDTTEGSASAPAGASKHKASDNAGVPVAPKRARATPQLSQGIFRGLRALVSEVEHARQVTPDLKRMRNAKRPGESPGPFLLATSDQSPPVRGALRELRAVVRGSAGGAQSPGEVLATLEEGDNGEEAKDDSVGPAATKPQRRVHDRAAKRKEEMGNSIFKPDTETSDISPPVVCILFHRIAGPIRTYRVCIFGTLGFTLFGFVVAEAEIMGEYVRNLNDDILERASKQGLIQQIDTMYKDGTGWAANMD
ncbi:hypothetical protein PG996_005826 [Apiospora saccharicola]|uniref:Phosphatidate cytidylyltransferase, mitochondrial n=1 Tax=Apiospora saccharicola TaxID=335842 RepID=A0ABR1VMJ6_9PEZI